MMHGADCPKVEHKDDDWISSHHASDDRPYMLNKSWYCGRCHQFLSFADSQREPTLDTPGER